MTRHDTAGGSVDLVVRNARIWTGDPARPWGTALAARNGRITAVGEDHDVESDGDTGVIDAGGQFLMPGIIDSHNHIRLGSGEGAVQLGGATTLEQVRARIGAWLVENPDAEWVMGEGFDYAAIPDGRHPRAEDLIGATGGRPAMLLDYSVHAAWFNAEALERLGVGPGTTRVAYGTFERDEATGRPTGYLHDYATLGLSRAGLSALSAVVPAFGAQAQYDRVRAGLRMAAAYGITTLVEPQNSLDDLALFLRARDEGELRSRVVAALFHPVGTTDADLDEFAAAAAEHSDDRFRVGPIKLYIDDIVEPHTAAMLEPYANRPDTRGRTYYEPTEFHEVVARLDARGFQCFVHATGDRGNRVVLDAFEHARRVNGVRDSRHQVVHVECLDVDDIGRFAGLGVVACMQPRHCAPEIVAEWRANVGPQRWRHAWPMRSLVESGAAVAFSSDWNVAEMDPLVGLYTALTRATLDGSESWVPEERVDVATALRAYTAVGAWANFCDHDRGVLSPGRLADFVTLSQDPFSVEPAALLETVATMTVVGGEVVHAP
jgi:predicted amidohydrolase YtcJ